MIGNDVVDLKAAALQTNWRRKGFLRKVFSAREQGLISGSKDQHQMVWLLWSMKEAAYKARQRAFSLPRMLNWQSLICEVTDLESKKATGFVKTAGNKFFTATDLSSEAIHTTSQFHPDKEVKNVVLETSSEAAKKEMLQTIAQHFSVGDSKLSITKDSFGLPAITYEDRILFEQFSLSDHGRFAAFSLSLRMS